MKLQRYSDLPARTGDMMLVYSDPGVGKSVTSLQTADLPILYIMIEGRDVKKFIIAAGREELKTDATFVFYDGFDNLMEFICDESNWVENGVVKYKTCIVDSISHLIAINLSDEILDESFEASTNKKSNDKPLTMRAKMSQEGYGTLGGSMLRFTNALSRLSRFGMTVICLARTENNLKYNRSLSTAPALKGQEYSKHFAGFMDFICLLEQRTDKDGRVIYPPAASFESNGSFMAKWTGASVPGGTANRVFHVSKILMASHGETNGNDKTT